MSIQRLAQFTVVGTATGFATSAIGASILHRGRPSPAVLDDALVGAVGGAAVNAVAGLVATWSPAVSFRHNLAQLGTSTLLVGSLGGIVGSLIMAGTGDAAHADVRHELAVGALGTLVGAAVGAAAWLGLCCCRLTLCCFPRAEDRLGHLQDLLTGNLQRSVDDLTSP